MNNPALGALSAQLEAVRQHARRTAGALGPAQLDWQPEPERWSVGQCLEHLTLSHERLRPVIPALLKEARARGAPPTFAPWTTTFFGRLITRSVTPGSRPVPTSKPFKPAPRARPDALGILLRNVDELEEWMRTADGIDLGPIRLASPFLRLIRYNVGEAFTINALHLERHLLQADRVKTQAGFPTQ